MNRLLIKCLLIFDLTNKLAKRVEFEDGINIITSVKENGNDVGKSLLLKSIYHTLGADSIFDDKWEEVPKIYIVEINVNNNDYYVYRYHKTFKIFSPEYKLIFKTVNRIELANYLKDLYNFCVKLPNKEENELEITPPVFSYLLNYVDQDYMTGSKFTSFKALHQYANIKENVIYNHFGIFNDEYFNASKLIEILKKQEKEFLEEKNIIEGMLTRVKKYLDGMDIPGDVKTLEIELDKSKQEYTDIVKNLKKAKNSLVTLRNEQIELQESLSELMQIKKIKEGDVQKAEKNICPTCSQDIKTNSLSVRISEYNELEDFYIMKSQLDELLLEVNRKIDLKEQHYSKLLEKFSEFEKSINLDEGNISDVLKHRGYIETRDNLIKELGLLAEKIIENQDDLKGHQKTLSKYQNLKKKADELYENFMMESVNNFGLKEISNNKIKSIKNNFTARGSNIPISTIVWYFNLLKIKNELNGDSIKFPLVLDSPNNVELDDIKREALFNYIFINKDEETQLILSTLGFDKKDYKGIKLSKVIKLENNKYELLNSEDFRVNEPLLIKVVEA